MQELKYKPRGFWVLDDASPFKEYSGYATEGTVASDSYGLPTTSTGALSHLFDATRIGIFENKVMLTQNSSFSISVSFTPVDQDGLTATEQQVAGNKDQYDGLVINGTVLSFTTKYTVEGPATCSYDLERLEKVHAVGVHTANKNTLYVNGEAVAEVDITAEQAVDTMLTQLTVRMGKTTSGRGILANNLAQFNYALTKEAIADIYKYNTRRAEGSIPKGFQGKEIFFNRGERKRYLERLWDVAEDFESGVLDGTTPDEGRLVAQKDADGLTINCSYMDSVSLLNDLTPDIIDSVNMDWTGQNIVVQTSVDETNWYTAVKGKNLLSVPFGFDPTTQPNLYIKILFAPGKTDAYVENMRVDGYLEATIVPLNDRTRTFVGCVNLNEHAPAEMSDDWGVHVTSGSVAVSSDTGSTPESFRTIEFWLKTIGSVTISSSISTGTSTTYTNGVAGTTAKPGQWAVYHYTYASDKNVTFSFAGADFQLGKVALYPTALSATEVGIIVRNYTGIQTSSSGAMGAMTLAEAAASPNIYAHDWILVTGM